MKRSSPSTTHVYRPELGVISVVAHSATGVHLEAGIVGPAGETGPCLLNGADRSPDESVVQMPYRSWRIEAEVLQRVLRDHREIHGHILIYAQAFAVQVAPMVLAAGRCTVGEWSARWILMCHDPADAGVTTSLQSLDGMPS